MCIRDSDYNVNQAKIAIGSGNFWGKGFLEGTQITYGFVPEKHTDFIFCTCLLYTSLGYVTPPEGERRAEDGRYRKNHFIRNENRLISVSYTPLWPSPRRCP